MSTSIIIAVVLAAVVGIVVGIFLRKLVIEKNKADYDAQGRKLINDALAEVERMKKEASIQIKDEAYQLKQAVEKELQNRKKDLIEEEKRFGQKLDQIERKIDLIDKRETEMLKKEQFFIEQEKKLAERRRDLDAIIDQQRAQLERISGISREEAKRLLSESIESEAKMESSKALIRIENETKIEADRRAKNIIALAIARYAGDYVAEKTVSVVPLPNEEMKGRIIGREGRNIRAIEAATGIDIIIDDTPEAVILSGFNPVRREVARQALERLIVDGRIHPARIEEIVEKVTEELEISMSEEGEQATFDVGAHGINMELIKLLGRLKYRTSYGQNMLQHSLEVAYLSGIIAAELGVNVKLAKRAGLLHDIGKAVDHEVEGTHAAIGRDLARKHGEAPEIVHAIAAHHEGIPLESLLDIIVRSADALSGARPGARKEMLESYVKRLEDLEKIATSFDGVDKAFAIQAGREIRIGVDSGDVSDTESVILSRDIAKKIEKDLTYPGQIKVTVIRETRAVEYAR
ncbi:MAG: ribonuclease Y [Desulfurivibrionaceae bacterium]|nr:ribonuclease Y [Desulfurivibrionaceae bacterium]